MPTLFPNLTIKMLLQLSAIIAIVSGDDVKQLTRRNYYYNSPQIPEIIINRATYNQDYNYPVPHPMPPPQFDEPSSSPLYSTSPPLSDIPPPFSYPPLSDPSPTENFTNPYLPPSPIYGAPKPHMKISKMSCSDAPAGRFFRATVESSGFPVVDRATGEWCVFRIGLGDVYEVKVDGARMEDCGVTQCGEKNLCLQLRMPALRGLRLPEDFVVNLQCKPQNAVIAQTKHLVLKTKPLEGRSSGTIASGGSQRNFESQVTLYRKTSSTGEFSQIVLPGNSVLLGEQLLIRAIVRDGDGWKSSRMGAVIMRSGGRATAHKSLVLVDDSGCRTGSMTTVCPEPPQQAAPLVTTLLLRAFMFQGAQQDDEMVLSVRMYACLQQEDCTQPRHCDGNGIRVKRETRNNTKTKGATKDWESYVDFRVVLPKTREAIWEPQGLRQDILNISGVLLIGAGLVVVMAVCVKIATKRQ